MPEQHFLRLPVVSAGAEHLVMGYLIRRNIVTYKAPAEQRRLRPDLHSPRPPTSATEGCSPAGPCTGEEPVRHGLCSGVSGR